MNIIYIINRVNDFKHLFPLIQESLDRGHQVELWVYQNDEFHKGSKRYLKPEIENMPEFKVADKSKIFITSYDDENDILKKTNNPKNNIDAIVSLYSVGLNWPNAKKPIFQFPWFIIMTGPDLFYGIAECREIPVNDIYFEVFSDNWINWGKQFLMKYFPARAKMIGMSNFKYEAVGLPELDLFADIDKDKVRAKYGLPKNKEIILYLPFPFYQRSATSAWEMAFSGLSNNTFVSASGRYDHQRKLSFYKKIRHDLYYLSKILKDDLARAYWLKKVNEVKVFRAVKELAKKHDLALVVKPRLKFPVAEQIKKESDLIVWDDEKQNDPPVLKELLSISRLTVSFFSFAALTSIFAKVFHLNVVPPAVFFPDQESKFFFEEKAPAIHNFPGVCEGWSIDEVISQLGKTDLTRFSIDPVQRKKYIEQYIGFDDFSSRKRVLDNIEKNVLKRNAGKSL